MREIKNLETIKFKYVRKDSIKSLKNVVNTDGLDLVCIRTYAAGVFIGYLNEIEDTYSGRVVSLLKARRLWKWDGAASLSQLAMEGVKKPENCKFSMEVSEVTLVNVVEMLPVTEEAKNSIDFVEVWSE
jgi:hypothetical protein